MSDDEGPPRIVCADPWCSVCENDLVNYGDGFECETCEVAWAKDAWDGDPAATDLDGVKLS